MISQTASVLPWMQACRPDDESRKSMKPNSDRLKPSSTRRALASLGVHPWRFAMRFRRLPLSTDRRMLRTVERVAFIYIHLVCNCCKYCTPSESVHSRLSTSMLTCERNEGFATAVKTHWLPQAAVRGIGLRRTFSFFDPAQT